MTTSAFTIKQLKAILLSLLEKCQEDERAHLQLRMIRDAQAPRFEQLKQTHPKIYRDFITARRGPHEMLLRNRREREWKLIELIEAMIIEDE